MSNPKGINQYTKGHSALLNHRPDVPKPKGFKRSVALRHQIAQKQMEEKVAKLFANRGK